jgi:hypothetical protein
MAENKTLEERLAEIEAKREAERKAKQKKKAESDKADAEYLEQYQTQERIKLENMQRAATDSAGNPQTESGKNSATRARKKQLDDQKLAADKVEARTRYFNVLRVQNTFIEKYSKSGKPEDRQSAINYQDDLDEAAKKYADLYGYAPEGYSGKIDYPKKSETTANPKSTNTVNPNSTNKPVRETTAADNASMQNIEDRRLANANNAPKIKIDPNVVSTYMASNPGMTYDQAVAALYPSGLMNTTGLTGLTSLPSRTVDTNKTVQTFTVQQLEGAATQYAQNLLGRALTANELASVTKFTNTEALKTPQISKTITNNNGTSTTSSTTTSGGIDEEQLIKSQIEQNPEYANYQKATTYFDAMLSSLQGPVGGGI